MFINVFRHAFAFICFLHFCFFLVHKCFFSWTIGFFRNYWMVALVVNYISSLLTVTKPLWNWLPLKYPTLTPLPLKCDTAQYHQTICTVKSHSRALATFQNIGKTRRQREATWIRYV